MQLNAKYRVVEFARIIDWTLVGSLYYRVLEFARVTAHALVGSLYAGFYYSTLYSKNYLDLVTFRTKHLSSQYFNENGRQIILE